MDESRFFLGPKKVVEGDGKYFITKLATQKFNKHNGLDESRFFLRPKTVED